MLSIIFIIMLVIVLYLAGIKGVEKPGLTNATYVVGLITITLTIINNCVRGYWDDMSTVLSFISLVFMFALKPIVRKLLDLYDINHQVKLDDRDRVYSKYEIYKDNNDDEDLK